MKAAAIYARVSTAEQVRGTSLDTQVEECTEFAHQHGYTVVKVIREDRSGADLTRPGLDEVRDLAASGQVQAVIVAEQDRLSRSMAHTMLLCEEFEHERVALVFVREPQEDTPEGRMLFQMKAMFKEYERAKIIERGRRGKDKSAREGKVFCSWAEPFGYRYIAGQGKLEILPDEAHWVRQIFHWYTKENGTLRGIARKLDQLAVPTKRGAKFWAPRSVQNILTNSTYYGEWHWNKHQGAVPRKHKRGSSPKRKKSTLVPRPADQWVKVAVPAIISREVFEEAQRHMKDNKKMSRRNCKHEYLLRGMLLCAQCNRLLIGRCCDHCKYHQYYCPGKYEPALKPGCYCTYPRIEGLDRYIWDNIVALLTDEERLLATLRNRNAVRAGEREWDDAELSAIFNQERSLKSEQDRLLEAYGKGVIELDALQERMAVFKKQREALERTKVEINDRIERRQQVSATEANLKELVATVRLGVEYFTFEDQRSLLQALETQCVVNGATRQITVTGIIQDIPIVLDLPGEFRLPDKDQRAL